MGSKNLKKGYSIAARLKFIMSNGNLTQAQMAKKAGVSQQTIAKWLKGLPIKLRNLELLAEANHVPLEDFFKPIELHPGQNKSGKFDMGNTETPADLFTKKALQSISPKSNFEAEVKTEIRKLISRVNQKVSSPGAKKALAKTLGVAPARISEWLSGKKEPGGEYTLRLLNWVEGRS